MGRASKPPRHAGLLRRALGLLDVVGVGRGAIIGAGLFVVTGVAAGVAGSAMLVGLVIAGAGAKYEYANLVLNPSLGFAAG